MSILFLILAQALTISAAWLIPGSKIAAFLGALGAVFSVWLARVVYDRRKLICSYFGGVLCLAIGFYWLLSTLRDFGGFSWTFSALLFLLFISLGALQFPLFVFIYRALPLQFRRFGLAAPLAWTTVEYLMPRIFPWQMGHTLLGWVPFVQSAELAGSLIVSFLLFWCGEAVVECVTLKRYRALLIVFPLLLANILFGRYRIFEYRASKEPSVKVALVQGNVAMEEKREVSFFNINKKLYWSLSREIADPTTLVVWPETVILDWIYDGLSHVNDDRRIPWTGHRMLVGALTYDSAERQYNSALAIDHDGQVFQPYHKQILMPFGEYTPLGSFLPWLREINATAGDFTAGKEVRVFNYSGKPTIRVAPLICYEDVIPGPSREAVRTQGANLLINLTNDAWYGHTVQPYQHNAIAAFRAIENKRWLLRATNTGLTSVVNALGETVEQLPTWSAGVLNTEVKLHSSVTLYSKLGDLPWIIVSIVVVLLASWKVVFKGIIKT